MPAYTTIAFLVLLKDFASAIHTIPRIPVVRRPHFGATHIRLLGQQANERRVAARPDEEALYR
ncbi:MAG: hypothetical protein C0483_16320 [Pirellula sp.]|nr:hypothetical protein [Pirellula sp.]